MSALSVQQKSGISYKGQYTMSKLINVCKKWNHVWLMLNKSIIWAYFCMNLKQRFMPKNVNPLPIILLFQVEKCILSESGEKYAQIKHYLQAKTVQNCDSDFDVRGQQAWTLSLDDALLWVILRGRWMLESDWLSRSEVCNYFQGNARRTEYQAALSTALQFRITPQNYFKWLFQRSYRK